MAGAIPNPISMERSGGTRRMSRRRIPMHGLHRKGPGKEAKLCFIVHGLMENRHGLLVDACLTPADGHAERVAALAMIEPRADRPRARTRSVPTRPTTRKTSSKSCAR